MITLNGRAAVSADPQGVNFPWHPAPLSEIGDDVGDIINDAPVVLLLLGGRDEVGRPSYQGAMLAGLGFFLFLTYFLSGLGII